MTGSTRSRSLSSSPSSTAAPSSSPSPGLAPSPSSPNLSHRLLTVADPLNSHPNKRRKEDNISSILRAPCSVAMATVLSSFRYADSLVVVGIFVCTTFLYVGISWLLIYRTSTYKSLHSSIDKASKKLESMKSTSSSSSTDGTIRAPASSSKKPSCWAKKVDQVETSFKDPPVTSPSPSSSPAPSSPPFSSSFSTSAPPSSPTSPPSTLSAAAASTSSPAGHHLPPSMSPSSATLAVSPSDPLLPSLCPPMKPRKKNPYRSTRGR